MQLTVDSISLANGFIVLSPLPMAIAAGDSAQVGIAFVPQSVGAYNSIINIYGQPCSVTAQSSVSGAGMSVDVTSQSVAFDTILVGMQKDSVLVIHNSGASAVMLSLQLQVPSSFSIDSASVTIGAGDSAAIGIHFLPDSAGSDTSNVAIIANAPCYDSTSIMLTGAAVDSIVPPKPSVELCLDSIPPATVNKPITAVVNLEDSIYLPVDSVVFDLQYDPTALYLVIVSSPDCKQETTYTVSPSIARITLWQCSALTPGTLCTAQFLPLENSNDTTFTQVTVDSIQFYPVTDGIIATGCSMPLTILPACNIHGVIYTESATSLSQNYPNPFAGTTTIHVTLSKSDATGAQLHVFNMLGERVADLTNQLSPNGDITFAAGELSRGRVLLRPENG